MKILCCDNYEICSSNFCVFFASFAQFHLFCNSSDVKASSKNVWTWRKAPCTYWHISLKRDRNFSLHSFLSFCFSFAFRIVIFIRNTLFYILSTYWRISLKVDQNFSLHLFLSFCFSFAFRIVIFIRNTCCNVLFGLVLFHKPLNTIRIKYNFGDCER